MRAPIKTLSLVLATAIVAGCASNPQNDDPYESYNRKIFKFNLGVDKHVYRPAAKMYDKLTPHFAQRGITNFFYNVDQVPTMANDLLQANLPWFFHDVGRFVINTTLGIGGLIDVAKNVGLERHDQDFGLTLAKWGVRESPYLMVPFFAPYTARDFFGSFVDYYGLSVWPYVRPVWAQYAAYMLNLTEERAALLPMDKLIDQAFDPYVFVRDSYLQNRRAKIQKVLNPNSEGENIAGSDEEEAAINNAIAAGNQAGEKSPEINPQEPLGGVRE